jgi:hypothetical protein
MTGAEIISAASGIAGLFTTTITWFDYIYVARKAAPRLQSLIVKLGSAQLRLWVLLTTSSRQLHSRL